jgi:uncharacterized membrane protein YdbT with pleckstrin-like domain
MSTELMTGERRVALVRQHWSVIALPVAGGIGVIIAGLVALALVPSSIGTAQLGDLKGTIFLLLLGAALVWILVHYLRWRYLTYLLTDKRIIVEGGVISRYEESIALDRIQNTVLRRPLADRLLGAGEIEIQSAGRRATEVLHRIPHAATFYAALLQAMQDGRDGGPAPVAMTGL